MILQPWKNIMRKLFAFANISDTQFVTMVHFEHTES
jgi:hypothetical protein